MYNVNNHKNIACGQLSTICCPELFLAHQQRNCLIHSYTWAISNEYSFHLFHWINNIIFRLIIIIFKSYCIKCGQWYRWVNCFWLVPNAANVNLSFLNIVFKIAQFVRRADFYFGASDFQCGKVLWLVLIAFTDLWSVSVYLFTLFQSKQFEKTIRLARNNARCIQILIN